MHEPTFNYVEHYIEFIGGYRKYDGTACDLFENVPPPVSLARYDVRIVESLSIQTLEMTRPYTDKQAELAVKLVDKYRRQLSNLTPSVILPDKLDKFHLGIRSIDRSKIVTINNNEILLKFPYDTNLIGQVRKLTNDGQGTVRFDPEAKVWHLGLTEYMINWIMTILPQHNFHFDDQLLNFYEQILQFEKQNYKIVLKTLGDKFVLEHGSRKCVEYIEQQLGGFDFDNILKLVDAAPVLGYEVDTQIQDQVNHLYPQFVLFINNRQIKIPSNELSIDNLLNYAKITDRLPLYFYDTELPKQNTENIVYINKKAPENLEPKLLVTKTPMMIGAKKQSWLATAEKVVVLE